MKDTEMKIRRANLEDVSVIGAINHECFMAHKDSLSRACEWVKSTFNAFPRAQYFVAEDQLGQIIGYILWIEKGGFQKEAVLAIEQITVKVIHRRKGIGTRLIVKSFAEVKKYIKGQKRRVALLELALPIERKEAIGLFQKTLGAKSASIITDLSKGDEMIMIVNNPEERNKR